MVYLLDVRRLGLSVRALVSVLEDAVIELLAGYGITAQARPDAPAFTLMRPRLPRWACACARGVPITA